MKKLRASPCKREGVAPENRDFPCLEPGWGNQPRPMNHGRADWLREREVEMYRLG